MVARDQCSMLLLLSKKMADLGPVHPAFCNAVEPADHLDAIALPANSQKGMQVSWSVDDRACNIWIPDTFHSFIFPI
jgi:hypothetical protein